MRATPCLGAGLRPGLGWALRASLLVLLSSWGCAGPPQPVAEGVPAPDLAERLPQLRERLTKIRGERLECLPEIERWSEEAFRRYLQLRWELSWPPAEAKLEERILVGLELWPPGLDYRRETLRRMAEGTIAAYLEDRDTIAVIHSGAVSDLTLVHELVHALQQQRWGTVPAPRTFEAQFLQTAWFEREAVLVEGLLGGASREELSRAASERGFPTSRPPADYWLGEDPGQVGPVGAGRTPGEAPSVEETGFFTTPRDPSGDVERRELFTGWEGLPYGDPPSDPSWPTGRALGPLGANEQIIGQRGFAWWTEQVLNYRPSREESEWWVRPKIGGPGWWWVDDRLRIGPESMTWRVEVRAHSQAAALTEHLRRTRPRFEVLQEGAVVVIRIPLPRED